MIARAPRWALSGLALLLGLSIVLVANAATDLILGKPLVADGALGSINAPDVAIIHFVAASLPMLVLGLFGPRSRTLWGAAILLTAAFWAYATFQIWQDSLTRFAGGANIGLGLIMIASPFIVLAALAMIGTIEARRRRGR
ncbi:hypothetical protein [Allosphingosinicella sp.]|uniref:hypothetical protein n=1 Tax=Allosphingosinicella sp. TaxID=2823234 RepID=UPI002FC15653